MTIKTLACILLLLSLLALPVTPTRAQPVTDSTPAHGVADVLFIERPSDASFFTYGANVSLRIGPDGLQLTLPTAASAEPAPYAALQPRYAPYNHLAPASDQAARDTVATAASETTMLRFPGANLDPQPFAAATTRVNVYPGADPATWRENLRAWHGVRLANLYPGATMEITSDGATPTWRLVCETASAARCAYLRSLVGAVASAHGFAAPSSAFSPIQNAADSEVGDAQSNPAQLIASTLVGGALGDSVVAVGRAADGRVYVGGNTTSTDAGYTGSLYVAEYSPDLRTRTFLTFLGAHTPWDSVADLAIAPDGSVLVAGTTYTPDFPTTPGAFDRLLDEGEDTCPTGLLAEPCPDAFAVKLTANGQLAYATFLGGSYVYLPGFGDENFGGDDYGSGIRGDSAGNIYVAGTTDSEDFPTTPGAYDRTFSYVDIGMNPDVFVVKLRPHGGGASDLVYSTYLGAGYVNDARGIALSDDGRVYGTGSVMGDNRIITVPKIDFPHTPGAYPSPSACESEKCRDVIFYKLNPTGNGSADLAYGTFFGGTSPVSTWYELEHGNSVAVMPNGGAVIGGVTYYENTGFPTTPGAFMTTLPASNSYVGFITYLSLAGQGGSDLLYSTLLGGQSTTYLFDVGADSTGKLYASGYTSSLNFPTTPNAFDTTPAGADAFVSCLTPGGNGAADLAYSTVLGGSGSDEAQGLIVVGDSHVIIGGETQSYDFPLPATGHDTTRNGNSDGFVAVLSWASSAIRGRITDADGAPLSGVTVTASNGDTAVSQTDGRYTFAALEPGTYTLTVPSGYVWQPPRRIVRVPPSAADQDFTRHSAFKSVTPGAYSAPLAAGDRLTYTVAIAFPDAAPRTFYDAIPTHTAYIPGSLSAPGSVIYDAVSNAITGTLTITPGELFTITFVVSSTITGTPQFAPKITNRACVLPAGAPLSDCTWSNEVVTRSYAWRIFLPLTTRNH